METERPDLQEIDRLINQGKLGEAAATCQEAEASYDAIFKSLQAVVKPALPSPLATPKAMGQNGASSALNSASPTEFPIPLPAPPFPDTAGGTKSSITLLDRFRRNVDWLFLLFMGLIVTALGVYVLWAGDPTWGSSGDILVAILWGLGLHSLTTGPSAYTGITDLAGRFGA